VQQADTVIEDREDRRRGRLVAELERKLEQAKKDVRARDEKIAELTFAVGRLETLLHSMFEKSPAGTRR
jgi:hypothetical protein